MAPEKPNPYQPPDSTGQMKPQPSARPNIFDWFFAIFLSLLAAAFVFPTTCFGSVLLMFMAEGIVELDSVLPSGVLVYGLLAVCVGITLFCAVWAARAYLRAVRKKRRQT